MSFQEYRVFSKYRKEESIALFVETLTGTKFEMSVFPHDTIMSIKAKIQRVEGIPIGQQHLLYNFKELDDSSVLADYSITNGSTIKLVLSMRGGPISTVRRILPLDDAALRELMESNRDELLDDLPPGCKMAVLVFRDGDQLNMFRVLENVDGSYSPLSESSMLNLFEDDGMLKAEELTKRLEENTVTMEKMYDLKTKMAELAIQRKTHKLSPVDTNASKSKPIAAPSASVESDSAKKKKKNTLQPPALPLPLPLPLPPISAEPREAVSASLVRRTRTSEFSRVPVLPEIAARPSPPPRVAVLDSQLAGPATVGCVTGFERERPRTSPDDDRLTGQRVCQILSDASRLSRSRRCTALPVHRFPRVPPMASTSFDSDHSTDQLMNDASHKEKDKVSSVSCVLSVYRRPRSGHDQENTNVDSVKSLLTTFKYPKRGIESSFSGSKKLGEVPDNETDLESSGVMSNASNRNFLRYLGRTSRSKDCCSSLGLDSTRTEEKSPPLSRRNTGALNRRSRLHSREGGGDLEKSSFQSSTKHWSPDLLSYGDERSFTIIDDCSYLDSLQDKSFSNSSKVPIGKSSQSNSIFETKIRKKKKEPKTRCTVCRKRLTVTNTYTCRCSNVFCNIHRYSEAHECAYDYKEEGRKILERNNPLITAPKLPKI